MVWWMLLLLRTMPHLKESFNIVSFIRLRYERRDELKQRLRRPRTGTTIRWVSPLRSPVVVVCGDRTLLWAINVVVCAGPFGILSQTIYSVIA